MLEYENIESGVADLLQNFLYEQGYNCPVVLANTAGKIPPYPYISFTVIEPLVSNIDHYIETRDGSKYKVIPQRWSFTVQSSDEFESGKIALMAYDYFDDAGTYYLEDIGVTVRDVGNITTRDNFISSEYEYRKGFDATFMIANIIDKSMYSKLGLIKSETITLSVNGSEEQIITINKE